MRRALILFALLPGLSADPAARLRARAIAPLPSARIPLELFVDGQAVGRGVALVDGPRLHVALRDPVGRPVAVLRAEHGMVGVQRAGGPEIVAADAELALAELTGGLTLEDLGRLLVGGAPRGLGSLARAGDGWTARGPDAVVHLDDEGRVRSGRVGPFEITRDDRGLVVSDGRSTLRVRAGTPVQATFPDAAFAVGDGEATLTSAERFARDVISR